MMRIEDDPLHDDMLLSAMSHDKDIDMDGLCPSLEAAYDNK